MPATLALLAVLSGTVQTPAHTAVPGAVVKLSGLQLMACRGSRPNCQNAKLTIAFPIYFVANREGVFTFAALPDGDYQLEVRAPGLAPFETMFQIATKDIRGMAITLHPRT